MEPNILLTSFQTWLPHQKSNSSDDLLDIIHKQNQNFSTLSFARNLPVDIELASQIVIGAVGEIRPDAVICCGMAESRSRLTVESGATCQNQHLKTSVDLNALSQLLTKTDISHDAGKFVCEGLYFQLLQYIQSNRANIACIFVHVPILAQSNFDLIQKDFLLILEFIARLTKVIKTA